MAVSAHALGLAAAHNRARSAAGQTSRRLRSTSVREPRKEAKPQDNGLSVQAKWAKLFAPLRNNPGVEVSRLSMASTYRPDYSVHIHRLSALTGKLQPTTKAKRGLPQFAFNVIGEAKSQVTSGSTDVKISPEIWDLAAAADEHNVGAFLIWDAPDDVSKNVPVWRKQAQLDMVAFVTATDLESAKNDRGRWQMLCTRICRMVRARHEVLAHYDADTGSFDHDGFAETAMHASVEQAQRFLARRSERAFKQS